MRSIFIVPDMNLSRMPSIGEPECRWLIGSDRRSAFSREALHAPRAPDRHPIG